MSFSYKTLNSNDIALTSYIANKQWEVTNATLSQNGVTIYIGENLPINKTNPFNPATDSQTEKEEYRRLIFDSIKNLYYQNYVSGTLSGDFYQSSSFFNYEQSTLISGSIRYLPSMTGSTGIAANPTLYGVSLYDNSSSLYDEIITDPDRGSRIAVISIDQNIFGSGLSPNTINISGSTYNLQDDGEGNIMDTLATSSLYVGNVFYSQGLIVITNQDYLCVFGAPPTSTNDYFSYLNVNHNPQTLEILTNDFADCGVLDPTSVQLMSVPGYSFPNYTLNNGIITITPDQTSIIPGNYKLNYTVGNFNGIRSNTSSIDLTITSRPLNVKVNSTDVSCFDTPSSNLVNFTINNGVPPYSYSLDNGATYTGIPGFFTQTVNGYMTSGIGNKIYAKDYLGAIATTTFNSLYPPITYTTSEINFPCSGSSNGSITVIQGATDTATQASINYGATYFTLPKIFKGLTSGSYDLYFKDSHGCITSSIIPLNWYPALTASFTQSNASCYGISNGAISVGFTNVIDNCVVKLTDPTGSYYYDNIPLSSFPNNVVTASGLATGSWSLNISGALSCTTCCQVYNNTFTITSPSSPITGITASYINSCSNAVIFSGSGGTPPYTYFAVDSGSNIIYSSTSSSVSLNSLTGGYFNTFIVDNNGCTSNISKLEVFSRVYQYTGSFCSQSGGNNTGYVSSSGIQQNFTTGPYSGSIVTSSYSIGSTLYGPTVNYKQLFVSGTLDDILSCGLGTTWYSRLKYDATLCPPGGCFAPILVTATPLNCTTNWTSSYTATYNSGSALATKTIIEYSYNSSFSPKATHSIVNASPTMLPFYTVDDFGTFNTPDQVMYFRAYNSCSIGTTSSYSNILTASCAIVPTPSLFTTQIKNHSGATLKYSTGSVSYIIYNNQSASISFSEQTKDINVYTTNGALLQVDAVGNIYNANVSSSNEVNGNVYTLLHNPIDPSTYLDVSIISDYIDGGYNYQFINDINTTTPDLQIYIDRNEYTNSGIITVDITPF